MLRMENFPTSDWGWTSTFCNNKKQAQIDQFEPLWTHSCFTDAYRGLPPCTLSQNPDDRESGYSNVLPLAIYLVYIYLLDYLQRKMYLYFSNTVGVPPLPTVVGHQDKKGGEG